MANSITFLTKVRDNWGIIVSLAALFAWIIGQIIIVTNSIAVTNLAIEDNKQHIQEVKITAKEHMTSETGHTKVAERLIKVETEVKHINTTQTVNFSEIKDQLKTIQQDVKKVMRGR